MSRKAMMERAGDLQSGVIASELKQLYDGVDDYDDAQVRQATVHARQDVAVLISQVADTYALLLSIRRWGIAFGVVIVYLLAT